MTNHKISFIIPMFNTQNYICHCIDSILQLAYNNYEILVIDDGSSDDSVALVTNTYRDCNHVILLLKTHSGLSATRNYGIHMATGDYIFFVDSDDRIITAEVDKFLKFLNMNPYEIFAFPLQIIDKSGKQITLVLYEDEKELQNGVLKHCYKSNKTPISACAYILKRNYFIKKKLFFVEGLIHEDICYTTTLLLTTQESEIYLYNKALYTVISRDQSITSCWNEKRVGDYLWICDELIKQTHLYSDSDKIYYTNRQITNIYFAIGTALHYFNGNLQANMIKRLENIVHIVDQYCISTKERGALHLIKVVGYKNFSIIHKIWCKIRTYYKRKNLC